VKTLKRFAILCVLVLSTVSANAQDSKSYAQSLMTALDKYEEAPSAEAKSEAKLQVEFFMIDYSAKLQEMKIQYDMAESRDAAGDYHWGMFVIKPEGKHPLNLLAQSLKRKIGVRVAYDPIYLTKNRGTSAVFYSVTNTLLLSHEAIQTGKVTLNEGHEIIHAHFFAQQQGRISYIPKAPVFIEMFAAPGFLSGIDIYTTYLSFEELVTYAYNIEGDAHANNAGFVNGRVNQLMQISGRVLEAVDKAMDLYVDNKFAIEMRNGQENLVFRSDFFALAVVMPKELKTKPQIVAYKFMQDAKALAEFNMKYFEGYEKMKPEVLIEKGRKFKGQQKKFIEAL
jgi:hypothetical protein